MKKMKIERPKRRQDASLVCEFVYLYVQSKISIFLKKLYNKKFYLHLYIFALYN